MKLSIIFYSLSNKCSQGIGFLNSSGKFEILGSKLQNTLNYPNQNNYRLIYADYRVLDLKRQWFINDRGCSAWRNGQCHDPPFPGIFKTCRKNKKKV